MNEPTQEPVDFDAVLEGLRRIERAAAWIRRYQKRHGRLPSIRKIEIGADVGHGTAQRARKLAVLARASRAESPEPGNFGTLFETEPPPISDEVVASAA